MNKQNVVQPNNEILLSNEKNHQLIRINNLLIYRYTTTRTNLKNIKADSEQKKLDYILYESLMENSWGKKIVTVLVS